MRSADEADQDDEQGATGPCPSGVAEGVTRPVVRDAVPGEHQRDGKDGHTRLQRRSGMLPMRIAGSLKPRVTITGTEKCVIDRDRTHADRLFKYGEHVLDGTMDSPGSRDEALDVIGHVRNQLRSGYWP